jgi:acetyltransferase-like isoleucine patch superfamily enzyme
MIDKIKHSLEEMFWRAILLYRNWRNGTFIHASFRGNSKMLVNNNIFNVGKNVFIGKGAWLSLGPSAKLKIGDNTHINDGFVVACSLSVEIGKNVLIADRVFIGDCNHGYKEIDKPVMKQRMSEAETVKIEDDGWIGINACILKGVTIGKHSVVGAGAVVTESVPPYSVVAGNPAKVVKYYNFQINAWEDKSVS